MYDTDDAFKQAVQAEWTRITGMKPGWYKLMTLDREAEDAWALYKNTKASVLKEQLLGETKMRSDLELLQNFGAVSGTKTTAERGTLFDGTNKKIKTNQITEKVGQADRNAMLRKGSVLNDGGWWTFKNDAWLLGCVHGLKVMQLSKEGLAQLSDLDALMWDARERRPRVLGRELIGLHAAGYKRVIHFSYKEVEVDDPKAPKPKDAKAPKPKMKIAFEKEGTIGTLGLTFAPMDLAKAMGLTFKAYYDLLATFTKIDQLKALVSSTSPHGIAYDDYEFPKEATVVTPQKAQQVPGPVLPGSTVPKKTWAQMAAQSKK